MTFTIEPGWWLLPLAITVAILIWARRLVSSTSGTSTGYLNGVAEAFVILMAAVPILTVWLIYAVLT